MGPRQVVSRRGDLGGCSHTSQARRGPGTSLGSSRSVCLGRRAWGEKTGNTLSEHSPHVHDTLHFRIQQIHPPLPSCAAPFHSWAS